MKMKIKNFNLIYKLVGCYDVHTHDIKSSIDGHYGYEVGYIFMDLNDPKKRWCYCTRKPIDSTYDHLDAKHYKSFEKAAKALVRAHNKLLKECFPLVS